MKMPITLSTGAVLLIAAPLLVLCSCSRPPAPPPPNKPPPPEKGTARSLVEDMSGYTQVRQGQVMKEKIKAVSAEHNAQMSDILEERKPAPVSQPPEE